MISPSRLLAVLRAAAALVVLAALVLGVPVVLLLLIGNPVPTSLGLRTQVTSAQLLQLLACVAWLLWAQMSACLIVEILTELRRDDGGRSSWTNRIPGTFPAQQALARGLVQAITLVGLTSATTTIGLSAGMHGGSPQTVAADVASTGTPSTAVQMRSVVPLEGQSRRSGTTVEVRRGDSLWSIAETHLGSGERWREIAHLNHGRQMPDGHRFEDARTILPGWRLKLPGPPRVDTVVRVQEDDTLWALADHAYGNGAQWPRIARANADHLTDPDLLHPGQRLTIPGNPSPHPGQPTPPPGPRDHTGQQPSGHTSRHDVSKSGDESDHAPQVTTPHTPTPAATPPPTPQPTSQPTPAPTEAPSAETTTHPPSGQVTSPAASGHDSQSRGSRSGEGQSARGGGVSDPVHSSRGPNGTDGASDRSREEWRFLLAGGMFLASGLAAGLLARRRTLFRSRRSGLTIGRTPPPLRPLEAAVRASGSAGLAPAVFIDQSLRELAHMCRDSRFGQPEVQAASLNETSLELHLAVPAFDPPAPWTSSADGRTWALTREHSPTERGGVAPYPALVTLGVDTEDRTWLVDLEALGVITIGGDPPLGLDVARDIARFLAAELAVNTWADLIDVTVAGLDASLVTLNAERLHLGTTPDMARLAKRLRQTDEALQLTGGTVLDQRATGESADTWAPSVLIADLTELGVEGSGGDAALEVQELRAALRAFDARAAVALIAVGLPEGHPFTWTAQPDGALVTPWGRLTPNRMSSQEANQLAQLLADADQVGDEPVPWQATFDGRPSVVDAAGALLPSLTSDRAAEGDQRSLLARSDSDYLIAAATTTEDLHALAPHVEDEVRLGLAERDPTLYDDLRAWADPTCRRPKLRLLGPVELTATGTPTADVERRPAYFAEIAAYLATHPEGVTPGQMAEAFGLQNNSLHSRMNSLRKWWGNTSDSDDAYLPPAHLTPAGKARGIPVYQAPQLLCDADLFRRLRARGEASGPAGIADLEAALDLVVGLPFDQLRPGGYGWLANTPADHYLTAGIVDVAHIVATHWLAEQVPKRALRAAERAIAAAPFEDKPRLDYARALHASGEAKAAERYLNDHVDNRSDDDGPPGTGSARSLQVRNVSPRTRTRT